MKKIGLIKALIKHYKHNGFSPEKLKHDLVVDYGVNISWRALELRWKRTAC